VGAAPSQLNHKALSDLPRHLHVALQHQQHLGLASSSSRSSSSSSSGPLKEAPLP
jgi:hypothetical protein